MLKLLKEGKKLQWNKLSQTALLFDDLTFFLVKVNIPICSPDLLSSCIIVFIIELIGKPH